MARRFLSAIKLLTGSTPPAGTAGDTFFDTDTKTIQIHDGNAWVNSTVRATDGAIGGRVFTGDTTPTSPVQGDLWVDSSGFSAGANILRWRETAVGGETSLSGLDDLGTTLSYTPGYELVHINGVLQVRGVDYVATTGTTITGLTALVVNDVVDVIAHSNMVYGDYYTQSQADARYVELAGDTMTGSLTTSGTVTASNFNNSSFANTAWSSTGLTTTNFSSTAYRWRVFNGVFYIQFFGTWSGGTITSDATGNIADQTILSVGSTYAPTTVSLGVAFDISGVGGGTGIIAHTSGDVLMRAYLTPSQSHLQTGRSVTFGASWCLV